MTNVKMTRRSAMVAAGMIAVYPEVLGRPAAAQRPPRVRHSFGCWLEPDEAGQFLQDFNDTVLGYRDGDPIIRRSGNAAFDRALAQTLGKLSRLFDVLPGFGYYDDYDGENALATAAVRLERADGTVLFGKRLLFELMRSGSASPETSVAAVCAHEFGHILQFKRGLHQVLLAGQPTVRNAELHADFLAGYFAGVRKRENPAFPAALVARAQWSVGDSNVWSKSHHGAPEQRGYAVVEGFKAAQEHNLDLNAAIDWGIRVVQAI